METFKLVSLRFINTSLSLRLWYKLEVFLRLSDQKHSLTVDTLSNGSGPPIYGKLCGKVFKAEKGTGHHHVPWEQHMQKGTGYHHVPLDRQMMEKGAGHHHVTLDQYSIWWKMKETGNYYLQGINRWRKAHEKWRQVVDRSVGFSIIVFFP